MQLGTKRQRKLKWSLVIVQYRGVLLSCCTWAYRNAQTMATALLDGPARATRLDANPMEDEAGDAPATQGTNSHGAWY